ncbi:MAG: methionyl-tRNA formyltransferase [Opitutaceae bacterium]|jgi:methionyl-tRNA formyltransferase|nr:methionyl-tRNA formyltransferase [Opitutaceae bacterium]
MTAPLRLVFMGSDPIALPLLNWIASPDGAAHARITAIYTQPDRPAGRGQKIQPNAIKLWALERDIPVLQPEKLTDETRAGLAALAPDAALIMAYGHILRDALINTPRLGTLNLHTSLLPKYRGASPIQTATACGERETGVSLMRIVRKLDAGPVADVERVPIAPLDTALDVEQKLAAACVPLVARSLPRLATNTLSFTGQTESAATYCRRLEKTDVALDFTAPAATLAARINGLYPWPACLVEIAGHPIKFGQADFAQASNPCPEIARASSPCSETQTSVPPSPQTSVPPSPAPPLPGTILPSGNHALHIAAGDGNILRVHRLQRPGGKMLPAPEFLRGFPIAPGTLLPSKPMPALVIQP